MPTRLEELFGDYEAYHRSPGNRRCHYIGIPLIVFSLLGLLAAIPLCTVGGHRVDLASLAAVAVVAYDFSLSRRLALGLGLFLVVFYLVARPLPLAVHWVAFVLGWALQFLGHWVYEKRSPAFFKNLRHVFSGPLWVVSRLMRVPSAGKNVTTGSATP